MSKAEAMEHLRVAQETLAAERVLQENGMDRDSVGRSYYAMFHAAQAVLVTHGLQARTHKGTIHLIHDRFSGPEDFPPDLVAALARTQKLREAADYDTVFSSLAPPTPPKPSSLPIV